MMMTMMIGAVRHLIVSWFLNFSASGDSQSPSCQISKKSGNVQMNYWQFSKFSQALRHAATLTFDPLTFNVCSTLSVTWSDSVPNFSDIEQFAAELSTI